MTFHATTPQTHAELAAAIVSAARQQDAVLEIFQALGFALTPSAVWSIGREHGRRWLLTSVRRAISDLSAGDRPALTQTANTRRGPYGSSEHCWELMERRVRDAA